MSNCDNAGTTRTPGSNDDVISSLGQRPPSELITSRPPESFTENMVLERTGRKTDEGTDMTATDSKEATDNKASIEHGELRSSHFLNKLLREIHRLGVQQRDRPVNGSRAASLAQDPSGMCTSAWTP